jgi:hypothetical protein
MAKAIRAGFDYENDDVGTRAVRSLVSECGVRTAMEKICGLTEESPLMSIMMKFIEEE